MKTFLVIASIAVIIFLYFGYIAFGQKFMSFKADERIESIAENSKMIQMDQRQKLEEMQRQQRELIEERRRKMEEYRHRH